MKITKIKQKDTKLDRIKNKQKTKRNKIKIVKNETKF